MLTLRQSIPTFTIGRNRTSVAISISSPLLQEPRSDRRVQCLPVVREICVSSICRSSLRKLDSCLPVVPICTRVSHQGFLCIFVDIVNFLLLLETNEFLLTTILIADLDSAAGIAFVKEALLSLVRPTYHSSSAILSYPTER